MTDTDQPAYPWASRFGAVLGLAVVALIAFMLADVATGGKLTDRSGCAGCGDGGADA